MFLMSPALARRFFTTSTVWDASLVPQMVKNLPAMPETRLWSLGGEDSLEEEIAMHTNILAWRIPWTEETGGLQIMGSQRVRHDWVTNTFTGSLTRDQIQASCIKSEEFLATRPTGKSLPFYSWFYVNQDFRKNSVQLYLSSYLHRHLQIRDPNSTPLTWCCFAELWGYSWPCSASSSWALRSSILLIRFWSRTMILIVFFIIWSLILTRNQDKIWVCLVGSGFNFSRTYKSYTNGWMVMLV